MYGSHDAYELLLLLAGALDVEARQEVVRDLDERVPRPALEPVHRAAGDEPGELERAAPELLANLTNARGGAETEKQTGKKSGVYRMTYMI